MDDFCRHVDESAAELLLPGSLKVRKSRIHRLVFLLAIITVLHMWVQNYARTVIGVELRLLAMGDSITWGYGSTDWNGFRGPLLGDLIGDVAYFIGSEQAGEMYYNFHEGRPGQLINTSLAKAAWALSERPNVILLHIGSNDIVFSEDIDTAPQRMDALIDGIFRFCPDATLLIGRLGPTNDTRFQPKFDSFSDNTASIVEAWKMSNHHVLMVDLPKNLIHADDFLDEMHPNDIGYRKMARTWYESILDAHRRGWIKDPVAMGQVDGVFYANPDGDVGVGTIPEPQAASVGSDMEEDTTQLSPEQIHALLKSRIGKDPFGRLVQAGLQ